MCCFTKACLLSCAVYLAELIFRRRGDGLWLNKKALVVVVLLFSLGGFLAWFSWTQIASAEGFPRSNLHPPACDHGDRRGCYRRASLRRDWSFSGPAGMVGRSVDAAGRGLIAAAAFVWATLWYRLVVLAFGSRRSFLPPLQ